MIDLVIARIQSKVDLLKLVGESTDFQKAAETAPTVGPAAFVFTVADQADPTPTLGRVRQRVHETIAVVYAVENVLDRRGSGSRSAMDPIKTAVRAALLGWQPEGALDPLSFVSGNQVAFRDGWQWWVDNFKTTYLSRG